MDDYNMDMWLAMADEATDQINAINSNYTQIKEAQKNRDLQQSMLNQNLAFQEEMYNTQFENLSPKKQRELLEEAGYNPAALVANGYTPQQAAAQGGSGIGSGAMPSQTVMPSKLSQNLSAISQQQLNNSMAKKAEAEAMEKTITNQTKGLEQVQVLKNLVKQGILTEEQANAYMIDNAIRQKAFDDIVGGYTQNTRKTQAEADAQFIQNELTKAFGPTKEIASIALLIAQGNEAKARAEAEKAGINIRQYEAVTNRINAATNQRNAATNERMAAVGERNAFTGEWNAMTAGKAQESQSNLNETIATGNKLQYIPQIYDGIIAMYNAEVARVKANDANAQDTPQLRKLRMAAEYAKKLKEMLNPMDGLIKFGTIP